MTKEWNNVIKTELGYREYRSQKKKILQKLDEHDNYAPIHYAVLSNNGFVCKELLNKYGCGKNWLIFFGMIFFAFFVCQDVNLLGFNAQTALHLAAASTEMEKGMSDREVITAWAINIDLLFYYL